MPTTTRSPAMATWRIIVDGAADGARNMAVDRALLEAHERGDAPPTLRLYTWERPTVSLGRFQRLEDVDVAMAAERGIGLCRRPTGGRGVLHADEVTYAIVAGTRDGLPRGVSASYRVLCGALAEAYREIGIAAELTARPRGERGAGACYLHATHADLSLGAAKLSGSAQVWSKDSCLQHGSFVLSRDVALEAALFRLDGDGEQALRETTCTIDGALERRPDPSDVRDAIVRGIARGMGVEFVPGELDAAERVSADGWVCTFKVG